MKPENAFNHGGHGEHGEMQKAMSVCRLTPGAGTKEDEKFKFFAVPAVFAVVEPRF